MSELKFQWNGGRYDRNSRLQYDLGMMAIDRLSPRDGEMILDIGCGNGLVTIELARRIPGGRVCGVEPSSDMIAQAERNITAARAANVTLVNISGLEITNREEFDAVFSNSAVHWIQDLETLYRIIYDSLKNGGRIMVQTSPRERNALVDTIASMAQDEEFTPHIGNIRLPWRFCTIEENMELLRSCGFMQCSIEPYRHVFTFETETSLAGYLESAPMVPFLSVLPHNLKEAFRSRFMERYYAATGHTLEVATGRLFISAVK